MFVVFLQHVLWGKEYFVIIYNSDKCKDFMTLHLVSISISQEIENFLYYFLSIGDCYNSRQKHKLPKYSMNKLPSVFSVLLAV